MTMPSEERYRELIAVLRHDTASFRDCVDDDRGQIRAGLSSLYAVLLYLRADPDVVNDRAFGPLDFLATALHDAERGARPSELHLPQDGAGTKPTGTMREYVQGAFALALEVLIKMKHKEPSQWLAAEIRKAGITTENGSAISSRQLESWRFEVRRAATAKAVRGAPAAAREHFDALNRQFSEIRITSLAQVDIHNRVREFVCSIIKTVRDTGPSAAPTKR